MLRLALPLLLVLTSAGCSAHRTRDAARARFDLPETASENRLANLERAARYPWQDDGRCAVRESSGDWATLIERCYDALDRSRIRFVDHQGVCSVAQVGTVRADDLVRLVGICLLVQPELAVGAVIVLGAFVVATAIAAEIEAARIRNPGCYCSCFRENDGPYPLKRVASPAACVELCNNHPRGPMGARCK